MNWYDFKWNYSFTFKWFMSNYFNKIYFGCTCTCIPFKAIHTKHHSQSQKKVIIIISDIREKKCKKDKIITLCHLQSYSTNTDVLFPAAIHLTCWWRFGFAITCISSWQKSLVWAPKTPPWQNTFSPLICHYKPPTGKIISQAFANLGTVHAMHALQRCGPHPNIFPSFLFLFHYNNFCMGVNVFHSKL